MAFISEDECIQEIINLEAILNLPKGTEHFVSDLHGEFEAFDHILRNGSGSIRNKVQLIFADELSAKEIDALCFLIYYPEEKFFEVEAKSKEHPNFVMETIQRLLRIVRIASKKYTRSKVRKALPKNYAYILEELIYPYDEEVDKLDYYQQIIATIIRLEKEQSFIHTLCYLIQRLVIDHLHVLGDIYDRGPFPDKIMEKLMAYHSVDIQFGNHDILWLGAFSGSKACMANVIRICARYGNLDLLEVTYGINLEEIKEYSMQNYEFNAGFSTKENPYRSLESFELQESMLVEQAMAIIQFKLEGQIIHRRSFFKMEDRLLLDKISHDSVRLEKNRYPLIHACFQTIIPEDPYALTPQEEQIVEKLMERFQHSALLKRHMKFLMDKGSLYLAYNDNLLLHGCLPMKDQGEFREFHLPNKVLSGKNLLDYFDQCIREAFYSRKQQDTYYQDMVWYLWCGENSSLFGKKAMKTFERYFIQDKETHVEEKNVYYELRNDPSSCKKILHAFHLTGETSCIINGHTPVKVKQGEEPVKADGKMIVIDGGFSRSYQKTTGIGGYTLFFNSYGIQLVAHKPFFNKKQALKNNDDIVSTKQIITDELTRITVKQTSIGKDLANQINQIFLYKHNIEKQK